jgi:hypothetical protein
MVDDVKSSEVFATAASTNSSGMQLPSSHVYPVPHVVGRHEGLEMLALRADSAVSGVHADNAKSDQIAKCCLFMIQECQLMMRESVQ